MGYVLVYKEITYDGSGKVKGNCDAELVLKAVIDFKEKEVFLSLVSPRDRCSYLLRKLDIPIVYLNTQRAKLELKKERAPNEDGTSSGPLSW